MRSLRNGGAQNTQALRSVQHDPASIFTPVNSCWGPMRSSPISGKGDALIFDAMISSITNVTTKSAAHLKMLQIADGSVEEAEPKGINQRSTPASHPLTPPVATLFIEMNAGTGTLTASVRTAGVACMEPDDPRTTHGTDLTDVAATTL